MNNAIKYIICAGAALALGFGAGYYFRDVYRSESVILNELGQATKRAEKNAQSLSDLVKSADSSAK